MVMVAVTALTLAVSPAGLGVGILLPFFLVYFVYVRERRHVPAEDRINHPYRTRLVEKYDAALRVTELLALAAYELILVSNLPMRTVEGVALLALAHLPVVVLYFYAQLKGVPGLDSLAVASAWSYLVVFTVLALSGTELSVRTLVVVGGWLLIVFAGAESRNLEDVRGDVETGNHTLATRIGESGTRILVWSLKLGGVGLFWYFGGVGVALLVLVYLGVLRGARTLSRRGKYGPA
jgi:hypothetical protein